MSKTPLVITTTTLVRTEEEAKTVLDSVYFLSKLQVPVVIVDGGSPDSYCRKISSLPNINFYHEKGLTNQLKKTFSVGEAIADSLFYLHTDKLDFITIYVPEIISRFHLTRNEEMLVISRVKASFEGYPSYQRMVERFMNEVLSEYMGKDDDYFYGPKLFPATLVPYLETVTEDVGWGFESILYALVKRLGVPINFYPVRVKAPKEVLMDEEEVKFYRLQTVGKILTGIEIGKKISLER